MGLARLALNGEGRGKTKGAVRQAMGGSKGSTRQARSVALKAGKKHMHPEKPASKKGL